MPFGEQDGKRFAETVNPGGNRSYRKGLYFLMMYEDRVSVKKYQAAPRDLTWQQFYGLTVEAVGEAPPETGETPESPAGSGAAAETGGQETVGTGPEAETEEREAEKTERRAAEAEPEIPAAENGSEKQDDTAQEKRKKEQDVPGVKDSTDEQDIPNVKDSTEEQDIPGAEDSNEEQDVPDVKDSTEEQDVPGAEDSNEEQDVPDVKDSDEGQDVPGVKDNNGDVPDVKDSDMEQGIPREETAAGEVIAPAQKYQEKEAVPQEKKEWAEPEGAHSETAGELLETRKEYLDKLTAEEAAGYIRDEYDRHSLQASYLACQSRLAEWLLEKVDRWGVTAKDAK